MEKGQMMNWEKKQSKKDELKNEINPEKDLESVTRLIEYLKTFLSLQ